MRLFCLKIETNIASFVDLFPLRGRAKAGNGNGIEKIHPRASIIIAAGLLRFRFERETKGPKIGPQTVDTLVLDWYQPSNFQIEQCSDRLVILSFDPDPKI